MGEAATTIGWLVIITVAVAFGWFATAVAVDAIQCARFVFRRIRLLPNAGFKPEYPKYRTAIWLWWRYLIGTFSRPIYIVNSETGIRVYWPGREDEPERYPG